MYKKGTLLLKGFVVSYLAYHYKQSYQAIYHRVIYCTIMISFAVLLRLFCTSNNHVVHYIQPTIFLLASISMQVKL